MGALAATLMVWYYSGAIHRSARVQAVAQAATMRRAQGDTTLPSLGVIQPPRTAPPPAEERASDPLFGPPPPIPVTVPEIPMANANPYLQAPYGQAGPPPRTPEELENDRRLGGPVLAAASNGSASILDERDHGEAATSMEAPAGLSPVAVPKPLKARLVAGAASLEAHADRGGARASAPNAALHAEGRASLIAP
jgi:type IV secretion system protein VirB10